MEYLILIPFGVLGIWFLGKMSKPASALAGLVGTMLMIGGALGENLGLALFGIGLVVFSAIILLVFNRGNW